jgi:hypothetical protein
MLKKFVLHTMLALALWMPPGASAQAPSSPAAIAGSVAVSSLVDNIKNSISELIDRLDTVVSARSFQIRTEMSFLLSEVEHVSLTLVDKTFSELNQSQQQFFERTQSTLASARALTNEALAGSQALLEQVEQIGANVPFFGAEPRVRSVSPLFMQTAAHGENGDVSLTVRGAFLRHGATSLVIDNVACRVSEHVDTRITFLCPKRLFVWETALKHVSGLLRVRDDASFWERVRERFGHYIPEKQYVINVTVVPRQLGTFLVNAEHNAPQEQAMSRTASWGQTAPHCREETRGTNNFSPQGPGWRIDVGSVRTSVGCDRRGGHAVRNLTENGFQVDYNMRNDGRCVDLLVGKSYDARGCHSGNVTWIERRSVPQRTETQLGTGPLFWTADQEIRLPLGLIGFTITVTQFDGRTVVLSAATAERWFEVVRDAESRTLIIRPKRLEDAFRS